MMTKEFITVEKLNKFRDSLFVGAVVYVPIEARDERNHMLVRQKKATIEEIYPHIARTSCGDFMYIDIYMNN